MSEEEIIEKIRDNVTDNESTYILCDALEDIIKNNNKKYDIQIIVSGLLDLYQQEKEKREIAEENDKVLSLDLGKALKELGLYEDTIIADELVLEINKRYISKDKIRKIYEDAISANYDIQEIAEKLEKELLEEE